MYMVAERWHNDFLLFFILFILICKITLMLFYIFKTFNFVFELFHIILN